jgi:hypothetical protein
VHERYEGLKEFLMPQRQEIENARIDLSKARSEFDERLKDIQAWEQHVADDEARLGDLMATAEAAAASAKTASDSANTVRAMSKQLQRQLEAQWVVHQKELEQLEAERITMVNEHNSVLGEAEGWICDQHDLLGILQDQLNELREEPKASAERENATVREASQLEMMLQEELKGAQAALIEAREWLEAWDMCISELSESNEKYKTQASKSLLKFVNACW